jgi:hypothetical protein
MEFSGFFSRACVARFSGLGRRERVIPSAAEESHGVSFGVTKEADCSTGKENLFVPRISLCIDDAHKETS